MKEKKIERHNAPLSLQNLETFFELTNPFLSSLKAIASLHAFTTPFYSSK